MFYGLIYKILCLINKKSYIGKTTSWNIIGYWDDHINNALKSKNRKLLYRAIRKYGPENFLFDVIDTTSEDLNELNDLETHYIHQYRSYIGFPDCKGYNMTLGGDGGDIISKLPNKKEIYERRGKSLSIGLKKSERFQKSRKSLEYRTKISDIQSNKTLLLDEEFNIIDSFKNCREAANKLGFTYANIKTARRMKRSIGRGYDKKFWIVYEKDLEEFKNALSPDDAFPLLSRPPERRSSV